MARRSWMHVFRFCSLRVEHVLGRSLRGDSAARGLRFLYFDRSFGVLFCGELRDRIESSCCRVEVNDLVGVCLSTLWSSVSQLSFGVIIEVFIILLLVNSLFHIWSRVALNSPVQIWIDSYIQACHCLRYLVRLEVVLNVVAWRLDSGPLVNCSRTPVRYGTAGWSRADGLIGLVRIRVGNLVQAGVGLRVLLNLLQIGVGGVSRT